MKFIYKLKKNETVEYSIICFKKLIGMSKSYSFVVIVPGCRLHVRPVGLSLAPTNPYKDISEHNTRIWNTTVSSVKRRSDMWRQKQDTRNTVRATPNTLIRSMHANNAASNSKQSGISMLTLPPSIWALPTHVKIVERCLNILGIARNILLCVIMNKRHIIVLCVIRHVPPCLDCLNISLLMKNTRMNP